MNDIKKVIKIDNMAIKPYFSKKNLLIYLVIAVIPSIAMKGSQTALFLTFFLAMLYQTYPFLVSESNGLDRIYRMIGMPSKKVVKGRYIWAIIISLMFIIIGSIISYIISILLKEDTDIKEIALLAITYFLINILIACFQYPVLFKWEYKKARQYSIFPAFMIFLLIALLGKFIGIDRIKEFLTFLSNNMTLSIIITILIILVIIIISIKVSEKFYKEKEI